MKPILDEQSADAPTEAPLPRARRTGLIVEELDGETLAYDLKSHEVHCLNRSAAEVWRCADGDTPLSEMGRRLRALGLPGDDPVVRLALDRLEKAGLLDGPAVHPSDARPLTRKDVVRMLGKAAGITLLLPAVASITAPLAAQAASCITAAQCSAARRPNCTGLPICENRRLCCKEQGAKKCKARAC